MNFVKALNAISSQIWALVLVGFGIATFVIATHIAAQDVRSAIVTAGTGMVGGALVMFRQQASDTTGHTTTTSTTTEEK